MVWPVALALAVLAVGLLLLLRRVSRLDEKREVLHLYENVEWNTQAVEYVKKEVASLKWGIVSWVAGLMLIQTVVIFVAIVYMLEASGR